MTTIGHENAEKMRDKGHASDDSTTAYRILAAMSVPSVPDPEPMSYADFGHAFFVHAVTEQRIGGVVRSLAGRPVEFGPVGVGPAGLVKVSATGTVGEPSIERRDGELVSFALSIPVELGVVIDFGVDQSRFAAEVAVRLSLTARAARPLLIVIDIEPPTWRDVDVEVQADGLRASVLQVVARVDGEIRKAVARYVKREIEKPRIAQARVIDVGKVLDAYSYR